MVAVGIATPSLYHWLPVLDDELNTTLPPVQKLVAVAAVIVGVAGVGFTVTVVAALGALGQPVVVTITV